MVHCVGIHYVICVRGGRELKGIQRNLAGSVSFPRSMILPIHTPTAPVEAPRYHPPPPCSSSARPSLTRPRAAGLAVPVGSRRLRRRRRLPWPPPRGRCPPFSSRRRSISALPGGATTTTTTPHSSSKRECRRRGRRRKRHPTKVTRGGAYRVRSSPDSPVIGRTPPRRRSRTRRRRNEGSWRTATDSWSMSGRAWKPSLPHPRLRR